MRRGQEALASLVSAPISHVSLGARPPLYLLHRRVYLHSTTHTLRLYVMAMELHTTTRFLLSRWIVGDKNTYTPVSLALSLSVSAPSHMQCQEDVTRHSGESRHTLSPSHMIIKASARDAFL